MKDKTIAAILAFFIGGLGAHRFYLGQTGLGFLYLLFCWTFIPAFIALIDFICFLAMSTDSFDSKYNLAYLAANSLKNNTANNSKASVSDEIAKLYELKERGIITPGEFEKKKKSLLVEP
jgi:TM2 domain-containing membrane protein YozV